MFNNRKFNGWQFDGSIEFQHRNNNAPVNRLYYYCVKIMYFFHIFIQCVGQTNKQNLHAYKRA